MKKTVFFLGVSLVSMSSFNALAQTVTDDTKTATFELTPNEEGSLLLETSDLKFGSHTLSLNELVLPTINSSQIKVTEFSGSNPGWTLKVNLGEFEDKDTGKKLINAKIFYPKVTPTTTTGGSANDNPPTASGSDTSFNPDTPTIPGKIVTAGSDNVILASAEKGKGFGEWIFNYDNDDTKVLLKVPVGQSVGKYSSVLTYSLEDTPTN